MAVVVQCYSCSNILELDDGFRGGVCRCSQCGSLLQVPKGTTSDGRKARPAAPGTEPARNPRPGNPTEDPGLSRGQFDPRSPSRPVSPGDSRVSRAINAGTAAVSAPVAPVRALAPERAPVVKKDRTILFVAIGLMVFVGAVIIVMLALWFASNTGQVKTDGGGTTPVTSGGGGSTRTPEGPAIKGPNFLGRIPLTGEKIVFSVDAGSSSQDCFDYLRTAILKAVGTLAPDQRFMIATWTGSDIKVYPSSKQWASKATLGNVTKDFENAAAFGSSDAPEGMIKSLQLKGDQTIFVTAKYGLTADMAGPVLAVRGPGQRIDAIKINGADTDSPLAKITTAASGKFIEQMSTNELEGIVNRGQ